MKNVNVSDQKMTEAIKKQIKYGDTKLENEEILKVLKQLEQGTPPKLLSPEQIKLLDTEIGNDWYYYIGFDEKYHGPEPKRGN